VGSTLVLGAVALGSIGGVSAASTRSGAAAATPQKTVTASRISRLPGTLAPGTKWSST
jgi:hypothetical protein